MLSVFRSIKYDVIFFDDERGMFMLSTVEVRMRIVQCEDLVFIKKVFPMKINMCYKINVSLEVIKQKLEKENIQFINDGLQKNKLWETFNANAIFEY